MKKTIILEGYISLRGSAGETAALQILEGRMSSNVAQCGLTMSNVQVESGFI